MTMNNDTKIEEELPCRFEIYMRNFTNFIIQALENLKKLLFNWLL